MKRKEYKLLVEGWKNYLNENSSHNSGVIVEAYPMGKNRSRPQKIDDYEYFKSLIDLDSVEFEPFDDPEGLSWGCFVLKLNTNLPHYRSKSGDAHDIELDILDRDDLDDLAENKTSDSDFELNIRNYFKENASGLIFKKIYKKLTPGRSTTSNLHGMRKVMTHHKETIIQKLNNDIIKAIEKKYTKSLSDIILDFLNRG